MGLIITLALGGFIAIGALISYLTRANKTIVQLSVALALGTLATLAVIELIPEAIEHLGEGQYLVLILGAAIGLICLMVLDRFLPDHDATGHSHGHGSPQISAGRPREIYKHGHDHAEHNARHIGIIAAIAVTLHNIIEGMAVYSISEQSMMTGIMVALGVGLHNIPMGMVIYATLHDRKKERTTMILLASLSTFAGGLIMAILWQFITDYMVGVLIAVTLGMILYIVVLELLPMVLHEKKWKTTIPGVLIGIILILISTMFE